MASNSLCIHGHFYQPPREDPFTGQIPYEHGAEPYLNWNERIYSECYRPNAEMRNFGSVSFDVGPTLFEWMLAAHPKTCSQIVSQDQMNLGRYGIGNAMAQPYHHTILPLATRRDKETQIYWGTLQFFHRFGRKPQGMWLPETAVDLETLEVLAQNGIKFTLLAPWQTDYPDVDCTEPYRVELSDGKAITVFFYHKELSGGISFNPQWTTNAENFLHDKVQPFYHQKKSRRGEQQLIIIASDGELYGHHQQFRDLFLAHLLDGASAQNGIKPTYLALWLKQNPPRQTINIRERTSWSCHHGVSRWKGDCGCVSVDGRWKAYLRLACDQLAKNLDDVYCQFLRPFSVDPWKLRNRYIYVLLEEITPQVLIDEMIGSGLNTETTDKIILLLEAQHQRQQMFASCAWYYDDFSRIESKNCLAYAAQAAVLAQRATGEDLASPLQGILQNVVSRRTGLRGDHVFSQQLNRAWQPIP